MVITIDTLVIVLSDFIILDHSSSESLAVATIDTFAIVLGLISLDQISLELSELMTISAFVIVLSNFIALSHS